MAPYVGLVETSGWNEWRYFGLKIGGRGNDESALHCDLG